jgi:Domain of unknown function (DUF4340)
MKKSYLTNLVLALVFAGLIGWYLIYEKKVKVQNTESEEKAKQLVSLGKDEIQEITLQREKNVLTKSTGSTKGMPAGEYDTFHLKKSGETWNLLEPVQDEADKTLVTSMLTTLTTTKYERIVDEKATDLELYGLKVPLLKISVKKDDKTPAQEVLLGRDTPVGGSVYASIASSSKVYKMPGSFKGALDKTLKDLRNKSLFAFSRFDLAEVEVTNAKETFLLKKDTDKDTWTLARENFPADTNEVTRTLSSIVDLKANDFPDLKDKKLSAFGLEPPMAKAVLTKKNDKTQATLLLGKVKDKYYAKRAESPTVYEVGKDVWERAEVPGATYRNKDLAIFNRFDVKRAKLEKESEKLELFKDTKGWTFPTEPKLEVDGSKVDHLLTRVQDTKISKYLTTLPEKLGHKPELTVHLFEKKEKDPAETEKVVLKFFKPKDKTVAVERKGLDVGFLISEDDFKKMNLTKQDFIKKEVPKPPAPGPAASKSPSPKKG